MKSTDKEINNRLSVYLLAAIIVFAFLIRLYHGLSFGFSNDELSGLARLQFNNLSDLLYKGVAIDAHPPFVQFFMYFWTKFFGTSLLAVRLPFILAGTVSVWAAYKAGNAWFNYTSGVIAASFIAFTGYTVLYGEIARPYSFGLLFSTLTLWYWGRIFIRKETALRNFMMLGIWVLLSMYTHYYAFFVSGVMFASALFFLDKSTFKKYIYASLLLIVFYIPYIPVFIQQMGYGGVGGPDGWLGKPSADWLWNYFVYVNNDSFLLIFVSIVGFIIAIISLIKTNIFKAFLLPTWFFIAFLFGYIYSLQVNPILQHSILLFCFPCLVIFIAYGLSYLNKILNPILSVVIITLLVFSTTDQNGFFKKQHFGSFDLPANDFKEWSEKIPRSKVFSIIDVHHPFYINYYLDNNDPKPDVSRLENPKSWQFFIDALENPNIEYLIFGWSTKHQQPEIYSAIQHFFPFTIEENIYFNSRMSLFSRKNQKIQKDYSEVVLFNQSETIEKEKQNFEADRAYGANIKVHNIVLTDSIPLIIEAMVSVLSGDSLESLLVIDALLENGEKLWKGTNLSIFKSQDSSYYAFTSLTLPENAQGIKELKVYIWNNKKERFSASRVGVQIKENKDGYVYKTHYFK